MLLAPITVSPTKPLTPTHLRHLLALDVLHRATAGVAEVSCAYDHHAYAGAGQTAAFWEWLDRTCPGRDFADATEEDIGELYVRHHAEPARVPYPRLAPYVRRARRDGWLHPSAERVLDLWQRHYTRLNLLDPRLGRHGPPVLPVDELVGRLVERDLCVDGRPVGAPAYLDLTAHGIPLRGLVGADGLPNYLTCVLGQLIPLAPAYELVVLMYDRELREDYVAVERVLRAFGARTARFEVGRVPLDGVTASARHGGWRGFTLDELRRQVDTDDATFRLALRLYLIAGFGRGQTRSFRVEELRRWVARAGVLRDRAGTDRAELDPVLHRLARTAGYVDPDRLTAQLLTRSDRVPRRQLLERVYP